MTDLIPVFVNDRRVQIARGGTAAAAAEAFDPALDPGAPGVSITDARGLPVAPDTVLPTGSILRVTRTARRAGGADADT